MESGSIVGIQVQDLAYYISPVENLTRTTNCYTSSNQLACLRNLTCDQLYKAQVSHIWNPLIDGDFLTAYPSGLMAQGKFARIPLLIGANSDEGCSFGAFGLNSETDIFDNLLYHGSYAISPPTARKILKFYPMIRQTSRHIILKMQQISPTKVSSGVEVPRLLETSL
jgi:cholinesterase